MNLKASKLKSNLMIGLLAGTAFVTTLGLTGNGLPATAQAEAVRIEAPSSQPGFADVVEKVSPAVVSVRVKGKIQPVNDDGTEQFGFGGPGFDDLPEGHPFKRFFREFGGPNHERREGGPRAERRARPQSQGSGFFISEDGYVVTNNHVVEDGDGFTVIMSDGTELDAKLIGKDKRTDLAVLKVEPTKKFTYVAFAGDKSARVGDWVVAVGNPFGLGGTVTAGIVSALGRDIGSGPYDDFIQIDAAVNRGNSGGPTFNLSGEVVGVNTAIFSPSGGNVGIAFAIPAATAKQVVGDLMKDGAISRGWLGVQIQPVSADIAESLSLSAAKGAMVNEVQPDSPAKKAGIEVGDVVLKVNGQLVEDPKDLARKVADIEPGSPADVVVWRDGAEKTVSVAIEKLADVAAVTPDKETAKPAEPQDLAELGIKVAPNDKGQGVVVTDVDPDSAAAERGLSPGDIIASVNDTDVTSAKDVGAAIDAAAGKGRKSILLRLDGENGSRFVALPVGKG